MTQIKAVIDDYDYEKETVMLSVTARPVIKGKTTTKVFTKEYIVTYGDVFNKLSRAGRGAKITAEVQTIEDKLHIVNFERDF